MRREEHYLRPGATPPRPSPVITGPSQDELEEGDESDVEVEELGGSTAHATLGCTAAGMTIYAIGSAAC